MVIHRIEKTSSEVKTITLNCVNALPSGVTIASATASATERSSGGLENDVLGATTLSPTSTTIPVKFTADAAIGESYLISVKATLSNSDIKEIFLELRIVNPS